MSDATGAVAVNAADLRRWIATIGRTRTDTFCALTVALHLARAARPDGDTGKWNTPPGLAERLAAFRREAVTVAFRDPIEIADLAVDGEDLRAAGVKAGPAMGRILRVLVEAVIADPARNTRDALLAIVRREAGHER